MVTKEEFLRQAEERFDAQYQAIHHPQNKRAMEQIKALLTVPGALKIITNEPMGNPPNGLLPKHPHYWVAQNVTRIEGPDHKGVVTAMGEDGKTYCQGHAWALLGRLTQYDRAAEFTEERAELGQQKRNERAKAGHVEVQLEKPMAKD